MARGCRRGAIVLAGLLAACDARPRPRAEPAYVPRPIPSAADSPTHELDAEAIEAWHRRNLTEAYQRVGRRSPRWDEAAVHFIAQHNLIQLARKQELIDEGRRIVALGCDDPLVQYLLGVDLFWADLESGEATRLLERSFEGMKEIPYPRGVARFVASAVRRDLLRRRDGRGSDRLVPFEVSWFQEALADGSYQAGDEAVLAAQLRWGTGQSLFERHPDEVFSAIEANEGLARWVRLLLSARRRFHLAYKARGWGWAHEVTPEGWKAFHAELALARKDLKQAWSLRPDRPEIAVAFMELVRSGDVEPGETIRMWFDRAVSAQIDYWAAYTTMLQNLEPIWHGAVPEMLDFARECVDTGRFDTQIPRCAFQALDFIDEDGFHSGPDGVSIYRRPEVFDLVARTVDGYVATDLPTGDLREVQTRYVVAAVRAERYAEACARGVAVDADLDRELHSWIDPSPRRLVGRACALSAAGAEVKRAEELSEGGATAAALHAFELALDKQEQPLARAYVRHCIEALRLEKALESGEWVPFLPSDSQLAGWNVYLGEWSVEPDGALLGRSPVRGMMIVSGARVGSEFEIRGEYEFVESSNTAFQAGVAFGHPGTTRDEWLSARVKRTPWEGKVAAVARGNYAASALAEVPTPDRGRFRVRSQQGRVFVEVNGTAMRGGFEAPDGLASLPDARVGFSSHHDYANTYAVRYRSVELRRLSPGRATGGR